MHGFWQWIQLASVAALLAGLAAVWIASQGRSAEGSTATVTASAPSGSTRVIGTSLEGRSSRFRETVALPPGEPSGAEVSEERASEAARAADALTHQECRDRLELLLRGELTWDDVLHRELLRRWLEVDRVSLQQWVLALEGGDHVEETRLQVAYLHADKDPAGALEWARTLQGETNALGLVLGIVGEAVRHDPRQALDVLRGLPSSERRDEALERAVMEWATLSGKIAGDWAGQIGEASLRDRLSGAAALGMAAREPEEAARLAVAQMAPGKGLDRVVVTIVQHWVQTAPDDAAAWVGAFPESEVRRAATDSLVRRWAESDTVGLKAWVRGLPEGSLRRQVVALVAQLGL